MPETRYTPEFAEKVCERMAEGASLREVCRDNGVPESSVRQWVRDDRDGFAAQGRWCFGKTQIAPPRPYRGKVALGRALIKEPCPPAVGAPYSLCDLARRLVCRRSSLFASF